jgi:hypothetical protein
MEYRGKKLNQHPRKILLLFPKAVVDHSSPYFISFSIMRWSGISYLIYILIEYGQQLWFPSFCFLPFVFWSFFRLAVLRDLFHDQLHQPSDVDYQLSKGMVSPFDDSILWALWLPSGSTLFSVELGEVCFFDCSVSFLAKQKRGKWELIPCSKPRWTQPNLRWEGNISFISGQREPMFLSIICYLLLHKKRYQTIRTLE